MEINCPSCKSILRLDETKYNEDSILIQCPKCSQKIKVELPTKVYDVQAIEVVEAIQEPTEAETQEVADDLVDKQEVKKLHQLIARQKYAFGSSGMKEVLALIDKLCPTKDEAIKLLNSYTSYFNADLLQELKTINTSYDSIKRNVSKFIELGVIKEEYPHDLIKELPIPTILINQTKQTVQQPETTNKTNATNVIAIVCSLIIVVGCFLPWIQVGPLIRNTGVDNPDGMIMLTAAAISVLVAAYNQTKNLNDNKWVYIMVGIIGILVAIFDLNEVDERTSNFRNAVNINVIGAGLWIVGLGSIGLLLCGLGAFQAKTEK